MHFLRLAAFSWLAAWAAVCAAQAPALVQTEAAPFAAAPTELTATRTGPVDIELRWKNNATDAAAYLIEYTTKPPGPYTIVAAVPPETNTFRHARLAPQTRFIYRVRALYGKPSNVVQVTTGKAPATMPPHTPLRPPKPVMPPNDSETFPATTNPAVERSVRDPRTADSAAPTHLTATLVTPVNVILRWQDNAQDEEGYVLEASQDPKKGFSVLGLFPPDTTEFEIPDRLPEETKMYYRVRAYFSKASNRAAQTTGLAPRLSGAIDCGLRIADLNENHSAIRNPQFCFSILCNIACHYRARSRTRASGSPSVSLLSSTCPSPSRLITFDGHGLHPAIENQRGPGVSPYPAYRLGRALECRVG
jgi:hypothetical protein